jgi:hypothetical protein
MDRSPSKHHGLLPASQSEPAPALQVSQWFNVEKDLQLEHLRGHVIALHAFQMLCPGCVSHALPQAQAMHALLAPQGLVTLGLHSVFEHHAAMQAHALEAFLHEYRIGFPVAVDAEVAGSPLPATLQRYGLRGTPSLVLIDRAGRRRLQHFGRIEDLQLGAWLGALLAEPECTGESARAADGCVPLTLPGCNDESCAI